MNLVAPEGVEIPELESPRERHGAVQRHEVSARVYENSIATRKANEGHVRWTSGVSVLAKPGNLGSLARMVGYQGTLEQVLLLRLEEAH